MKRMIVYKYPLGFGVTCLQLPEGAQLLHVDVQAGKLALWALVDKNSDTERRWFYVAATGESLKDGPDLEHISTVKDGPYVWHVFESINR